MAREKHAEVTELEGALEIVDLTGASLLWVDGKPTARAPLVPGTELRVGRLALGFALVEVLEDTVHPMDVTAKRPTPFRHSERGDSPSISALKSSAGRSAPRPAESGRFAAGQVIEGRYRIVARIAAGGMGEVFKVEHLELGKQLALKVMLPGLTADNEFVNRFKIEAVAASRIGHPNIVDISDFGKTADGRFYFVMEFLDGLTLSSLVHRQGAQPVGRVAALGLQIARALTAAHELHIVHRDLKPDNVMVLQRPGNPDLAKVLDFGVARVHVDSESIGKTAAGLVVGTPQYMSPEQAKAIVVDARSDIYSLGLILHELLIGKPTFTGETAPIVMVKQVTELPPELPAHVPDELNNLISAMLEKNPADRPQQMKEVVAALDAIAHTERSLAPTDPHGGERVPTPVKSSGRRPVATPLKGQPAPRARTPVRPSSPRVEPALQVADEEPVVPPSSPVNPLLIGLLVGLVLVVVGGGVLLLGPSRPQELALPAEPVVIEIPVAPKVTPPPEPPAEVVVRVVSSPEGVEVSENGVMLGNTPLPLRRKPNTILELTLSLAGYQPAQRKVMVSADAAVVSVTLEKVKGAVLKPKPQPRPELKPLPPSLDIKPAPF